MTNVPLTHRQFTALLTHYLGGVDTLELLQDHYERNISCASLARRVGVHRTTILRRFQHAREQLQQIELWPAHWR